MRIRVECYAGYRGEETPRCLVFDGRAVDVAEVVDRWLAPEHRYFKLRGADDAVYIVLEGTGVLEVEGNRIERLVVTFIERPQPRAVHEYVDDELE